MALQNDPRIFSGGSAVFNTQPDVAFYANMLARREAKNQALDDYYRKLPSTINDQGVRDQDRPYINQQINDAMGFWMKNKDALRNPKLDGGKAQLEFEQRFRQARQTVDESKQLGKTGLELGKMKFYPTKQYIFEDPGIIDTLHSHDLPINDPSHKGIDLATMTVPLHPFGAKEQEDLMKTSIGQLKPSRQFNEKAARTDSKSGQIFVPYQDVYNPGQIKTIADTYGNAAEESLSAKRHYENLMHDPKFFEQASAAYKSVYGQNEIMDTPAKAAKAEAIIRAKNMVTNGEQMRADANLAFQRQVYLKNYEHELKQGDQDKANLWIDKYVSDITDKAKQTDKGFIYKSKDGQNIPTYEIQQDPTLRKAIGFNDKTNGVLLYTPDGNYIIAPYKTNDKYEIQKTPDGTYAIDTEKAVKISSDQLKLALGKQAGVKQLNKEMSGGTPKPVQETPIGTRAEWKAAGWTDDQINTAVKSGRIKIK